MKTIMLAMLVVVFIVTPVFAKDYIKATDIQKVSLGDTFEQVAEKIGEPQQVLSKELIADGKEQVIWLYETIKPFKTEQGILGKGLLAGATMAKLESYKQERVQNPPYLVIFINGKASKIERQKIDPSISQPVGVMVY